MAARPTALLEYVVKVAGPPAVVRPLRQTYIQRRHQRGFCCSPAVCILWWVPPVNAAPRIGARQMGPVGIAVTPANGFMPLKFKKKAHSNVKQYSGPGGAGIVSETPGNRRPGAGGSATHCRPLREGWRFVDNSATAIMRVSYMPLRQRPTPR